MHLTCLAALLASAILQSVRCATVTWAIPTTPQTVSVTAGAEVTFTWTGNHNVYKSANKADYDSCTKTGGTMVAPATSGGTWKTTLSMAGTYYYICEVGMHCAGGQKVAITVTAANNNGNANNPAPAPEPEPMPTSQNQQNQNQNTAAVAKSSLSQPSSPLTAIIGAFSILVSMAATSFF